jgi:hypothetical protein
MRESSSFGVGGPIVVVVNEYVSELVSSSIQQPTSWRFVGVQRESVCAQRLAAWNWMAGSSIISVSEGKRTCTTTGPTSTSRPSAVAWPRTSKVPAMRAVHVFPEMGCQPLNPGSRISNLTSE